MMIGMRIAGRIRSGALGISIAQAGDSMRMLIAVLACLGISLSSRAAEPSAPAASAQDRLSLPKRSASQSASAGAQPSATSPKETGSKDELTSFEKVLLSEGYLSQMRGGRRYFCRRQAVLGSNIEQKVCRTEEQIRASQQDSREYTERLERDGYTPTGR
jgi:hypothetical protein